MQAVLGDRLYKTVVTVNAPKYTIICFDGSSVVSPRCVRMPTLSVDEYESLASEEQKEWFEAWCRYDPEHQDGNLLPFNYV